MPENILTQFAKALTSGEIRVVDLSQPLDATTAVIQLPPEFGKSWPFRLEEISKYDDRGPAWYWNNFSCGEHTGTHTSTHPFTGSPAKTSTATRPIPSPSKDFSPQPVSSTSQKKLPPTPISCSPGNISKLGKRNTDESKPVPGS